MKDLVVLVADKDTQFTLHGLFSRNKAFSIRDISQSYDIFVHIQRDPGCYHQCADFLRPFSNIYSHTLVIFDHEGSGQEKKNRNEIEIELEDKLKNSGWGDRASVILIEPELEIWVWSDSPHVEKILGWEDRTPNLRTWLNQKDLFRQSDIKPSRPKEVMQAAMREVGKARSPAIFQQLAEKVSFKNCKDSSFQKLIQTLQNWFPEY